MKLLRITVVAAIGCSLFAGTALAQNVIPLTSVPANYTPFIDSSFATKLAGT